MAFRERTAEYRGMDHPRLNLGAQKSPGTGRFGAHNFIFPSPVRQKYEKERFSSFGPAFPPAGIPRTP